MNGHIESKYTVASGKWSEPEFVVDPVLRIHGLAPGLNYGQQSYEGLKALRTPEGQIQIFRPDQNAKRMQHSTSFISVPPIPEEHFVKCVHLAVGLNAEFVPPHETGASLYIRPLVFGSCAQLGLNPPAEYLFVVYVLPVGVYHGVDPVDALILEEFDRAAPHGTGSAKIGGNYAPVLRWSEKAHHDGYGITLHLDSQTRTKIDEFSTSGFIGLKAESNSSYTMVVPESNSVINSVTSSSCQELARSFGWTVEKREVPFAELSTFSEVLAAGTAAALVPIKSITRLSSNDKFLYHSHAGGDSAPGPCCNKLLTALKGIQSGKIADPFGWTQKVQAPDAKLYTARKELNGHAH